MSALTISDKGGETSGTRERDGKNGIKERDVRLLYVARHVPSIWLRDGSSAAFLSTRQEDSAQKLGERKTQADESSRGQSEEAEGSKFRSHGQRRD